MEIEKHVKPRSKLLLKFLPKAASAVYFSAASYSPKHKTHRGIGFSGPLIPDEARRNPRNVNSYGGGVDEAEPTSPKVSCMGQIKHKKELRCESKKAKRAGLPPRDQKKTTSKEVVKKQAFGFRRMFSGVNTKRKSDVAEDRKNKVAGLPDRAPSLSQRQRQRFASGRGQAFANFDWQVAQARVAPRHDDENNLNYHSDEERDSYSDHEDREHTKITFSAPLMIGGSPGGDVAMQPRKEINLWKRRTMAPPSPLKVGVH